MDCGTQQLRRLIQEKGLIMAPGVVDAGFARLVAAEGFPAVYMTGGGTTASRLGMPDIGLLTMTEMVDNAARIADACEIPVIADADTGYGGPLNVYRTIRSFEAAGVAAVHVEDQVWPKRCGHFANKQLIPVGDMVAKVKAACDARRSDDFVVIARTDAYSVEGYNSALDRAARYAEAGADVLFVEELRSKEELEKAARTLTRPLLYNMASSGKTPFLAASEIERMGFRIVIYPNFIMLAALKAAQNVLRELKSTGSPTSSAGALMDPSERQALMRIHETNALEAKYAGANARPAGY